MPPKLKTKDVRARIDDHGHKLITKTYKGQDQEIRYRCKCGHATVVTTLRAFTRNPVGCKSCNKEVTKQKMLDKYGVESHNQDPLKKEKTRQTFLKNYGVENPMSLEYIKAKSRKTCRERYGVDFALQSEQAKAKGRHTCIKKYGVGNPMQNEAVKQTWRDNFCRANGVDHPMKKKGVRDKQRATTRKNYGVEYPLQHPDVRQKLKDTCMKKYGVDSALSSLAVQAKRKETLIERYGVDNPMKHPLFFDKASKSMVGTYEYTFPSGRKVYIQGYEKYALRDLLSEGYDETQICIGDRTTIPTIIYEYQSIRTYYYPDIYIPNENKIIEIKSTYTYRKDIGKNVAKFDECLRQGYDVEFWIYNTKGEIDSIIYSS